MSAVAIIGRPNVGKSTLFNRLTGRREAIVDDRPGITRDRIYGFCEYLDTHFIVIDTGGLSFADDPITTEVRKQVDFAIDEADKILFVVDGREGLHPLDKEIAEHLKKKSPEKPIAVVIAKMDRGVDASVEAEFTSLGFEPIFTISAFHKIGIGDMLDWVIDGLEGIEPVQGFGIAVVGKPNVGKSSFVNAILGYERSIVTEIPGTTRDSIDTPVKIGKQWITLIDTGGLKKKSRMMKEAIEYYTMLRTVRSIERSHVSLVLIDSSMPVTRQDKRIISLVEEGLKGLVIVLTKVDLIPKKMRKKVLEYFQKELSFVSYAPFLMVSSVTGEGVNETLKVAIDVAKRRRMRRSKKELNRILRDALRKFPPPMHGRKVVRIYRIYEEGPGRFILYMNIPEALDSSYIRYLERSLREGMDFFGIPIRIIPKGERP